MSSFYLLRGTDPAGTDRIDIAGEMLVGRSDECDVTVRDGHPSRRHARLTVEDGHLWLEDLGSANGTFVNDRQIAARTELHPGDRVAFDQAPFTVGGTSAGDNEATVVRKPPEDPNATVVRPLPAEPDPVAAATPAADPAPAPQEPTSATPANVPRSWADPDYQAAGTRMLSRDELAAMAAGSSPAATAGESVRGPHLRVLAGASAGEVLRLDGQGDEWTVGSDAGRDLVLSDAGISGFHAKISHDGGRWRIIDQMSANGTWVNGDKITVSYVGNGDRVRFAQVECEVQLGNTARRTASGGDSGSTRRTWVIAAVAAATTIGVLALMSWLG